MTKTDYSKRGVILLCSLVYFVSYFSRKSFAAVMAGMLAAQVLDKSTAGFVGMALFICYGAGQLISGYLGDKTKPQYLLLIGLIVTTLCNFLMPLVPNSTLMIPVWALNGLAQAMLWPPIVRILADNLNHEQYVTANVVVTTAAHVATILLYLYVPVCLTFMTWRAVFFSATLMAAVACVVFVLSLGRVLPDSPTRVAEKTEKTEISGGEPFFRTVLHGGILPIFGCIVMMGFLRDGIESWLPTLYGEAFGRDSAESVLVSVILPIFSVLSIIVVTALHRGRLFNNEARGSVILFLVAAAVSVPVYFMIEEKSLICRVLCLFFTGFICACMHACNFILISCLPGRFRRVGRASTVSGFCNACTYVGAAISMYGIALTSETMGWPTTILLFGSISLLGAVLSALSYRRYTKNIVSAKELS